MVNDQKNFLTIDVEDYFHVSNFSQVIQFSEWDKYECRIERNTFQILNMLSEYNIKATFFVLGWIAERYPNLIKKIYCEGHEISSHGYCHKLVTFQTRREFRENIRNTKKILEDIIGEEVLGYRAPSFSLTQKSFWALEILKEEGFRYDSSIFPIRYYHGKPRIPRFPFFFYGNKTNLLTGINHSAISIKSIDLKNSIKFQDGCIIEFPISVLKIYKFYFPIAGGGYFRLLPYLFIKWGLKRINNKEKKLFTFYFHPWEFDVDQPRIKDAPNLSKFRHYINLNRTEAKIRKLLKDFNFSRIKDVIEIQ